MSPQGGKSERETRCNVISESPNLATRTNHRARFPRRVAGDGGKEARQATGIEGSGVSRWSRDRVGVDGVTLKLLSRGLDQSLPVGSLTVRHPPAPEEETNT